MGIISGGCETQNEFGKAPMAKQFLQFGQCSALSYGPVLAEAHRYIKTRSNYLFIAYIETGPFDDLWYSV